MVFSTYTRHRGARAPLFWKIGLSKCPTFESEERGPAVRAALSRTSQAPHTVAELEMRHESRGVTRQVHRRNPHGPSTCSSTSAAPMTAETPVLVRARPGPNSKGARDREDEPVANRAPRLPWRDAAGADEEVGEGHRVGEEAHDGERREAQQEQQCESRGAQLQPALGRPIAVTSTATAATFAFSTATADVAVLGACGGRVPRDAAQQCEAIAQPLRLHPAVWHEEQERVARTQHALLVDDRATVH